MDATQPARGGQDKSARDGLLGLVIDLGGGWFPPPGSGTFSARVWAALLGKDEKTIRRWVKANKVPYRVPGDEMFISSDDFTKHIPYVLQEPEPDTEE